MAKGLWLCMHARMFVYVNHTQRTMNVGPGTVGKGSRDASGRRSASSTPLQV